MFGAEVARDLFTNGQQIDDDRKRAIEQTHTNYKKRAETVEIDNTQKKMRMLGFTDDSGS